MTVGTRLRGNQGLLLTLQDGVNPADDVAGDVKSWELNPEDGEDGDVTFEEAQAGATAQWVLKLKFIVSFSTGSLWSYLWDNSGQDRTYVLGPAGNATPSTDKPHFTGLVNLGKKPGLANEARTTKEGAEFEVELQCVDEPQKITA